MIWTDGSSYTGNWVKGIQHGRGKMTFPNGTIKDGYFENNIFKGETPTQRLQIEMKNNFESKKISLGKHSKMFGNNHQLLPIMEKPR